MTPNDIFETLGNGALSVLPWIANAILGAIGLYFAVLGIRKGLAWFFAIVEERRAGRYQFTDADRHRIDGWAQEALQTLEDNHGFGYHGADIETWIGAYIDGRSNGSDHDDAVKGARQTLRLNR